MKAFAAVLILAGLAGMLPVQALAHGTISPTSAPRGSTQSFVVVVPNISVNVPLTGFRLTPPAGVDIAPEEDPDWSTTIEGRTLVWSGGEVPAGGRQVRLPGRPSERRIVRHLPGRGELPERASQRVVPPRGRVDGRGRR